MVIEKIQKILKQQNKKLLFYFDGDGTFFEELLAIEEAGIKVVLVENNYFELKYKLEYEWNKQPVFLYHAFNKPTAAELKKYPLLDLLIANTELRTDDASEFIEDYHLKEHHLPLVKRYLKQLKSKTNQNKLAQILEPSKFSKDALKLGLMSITLGFSGVMDKHLCMAKWLAMANDEDKFAKANKALDDLELSENIIAGFNVLLNLHGNELNTAFAKEIACKLKYNILAANVTKVSISDSYSKLKIDRTTDINRLRAFIQDWLNHPTLKNTVETVFDTLGEDIKSSNLMEWYGSQHEFGFYSDEMLNEIIVGLYHKVADNPLKTKDDCIKWMRSSMLNTRVKHQVDFIYHTATVFGVLESYRNFQFNTPNDFVTEYTQELFKIDSSYRKAVSAFDNARDHLYEFEDNAVGVFNKLNQKYDRFLIDLNVEWQKVLSEQNFNLKSLAIDKQYDFYKNNLEKFDYKIVVIISDAFRYEVGHQLYKELLSESKNEVSIEPYLASIPSNTNLGMTNLLPHKTITAEKTAPKLSYKIDGKSTVSSNRAAILQTAKPESATIDFSELKKMSK